MWKFWLSSAPFKIFPHSPVLLYIVSARLCGTTECWCHHTVCPDLAYYALHKPCFPVLIQARMVLKSHCVSVQGQSLSDKQVIFGNRRSSYCETLNVAPVRYTEWGVLVDWTRADKLHTALNAVCPHTNVKQKNCRLQRKDAGQTTKLLKPLGSLLKRKGTKDDDMCCAFKQNCSLFIILVKEIVANSSLDLYIPQVRWEGPLSAKPGAICHWSLHKWLSFCFAWLPNYEHNKKVTIIELCMAMTSTELLRCFSQNHLACLWELSGNNRLSQE